MRRGDLARLLLLPAALSVTSLVVGVVAGERGPLVGHAAMACLGCLAAFLCRRGREVPRIETRADAFRTVAVAWLAVSVLGGVPFLVAAWLGDAADGGWVPVFRDPWCALFEGVSGFTSTGLTVVEAPSELPASLQWWRSLMQWVGGIGVVLLVTALMADVSRDAADDDASGLHEAEFGSEFRQRAAEASRQVVLAYLPLSLATILLFGLTGMPWWEATNHGLTAISTGGFTVTDDGFAGYGEGTWLLALVPMVIGALSFTVLLRLLRVGDLRRLLRDHALHLFLVGGLLLTAAVAWLGGAPAPLVFDALSAFTTTGFSASGGGHGTAFLLLLLTVAMFVGGMRGSTAGGWKVDRLMQLGHGLHRQMRGLAGSDEDSQREAAMRAPDAQAGRLLLAWSVSLLVGACLLQVVVGDEHGFVACLFEAISALSTVGLSEGITAPELPWSGKLVLIALMWLGRLEILPCLLLLYVGCRPRRAAA